MPAILSKVLVLILPVITLGCSCFYDRCDPVNGPGAWPGTCRAQTQGSPINLCGAVSVPGLSLQLQLANYDTSFLNLPSGALNLIFDVLADPQRGLPTLTANSLPFLVGNSQFRGNQVWILQKVQLHIGRSGDSEEGSEHFLEGVQFAGELQFVHFNSRFGSLAAAINSGSKDALLIVSVMLQLGEQRLEPGALGLLVNSLLNVVGGLLNTVVNGVVNPLLGTVGGTVNNVVNPLLGTVTGTVNGVVNPLLGTVGGTVNNVVNPLLGTVTGTVNNVVNPLLGTVGGTVNNVVNPLLGTVTGTVNNVVNPLLGTVTGTVNGVVNPLVGTVGGTVNNVVNPLLGTTAGVVNGVVNPLLGTVAGTVNNVANPLLGTVSGTVNNVVNPLLGTVTGTVNGVVSPLLGTVGGLLNPLLGTVGTVVNPLLGVTTSVLNPVLGTVGTVVNPLLGTVGAVLDPLLGTVGGLLNGLLGPLLGGTTTVQASLQLQLSQLLDATSPFYLYAGSLTTLPCSEIVTWVVLKNPKVVSLATLQNLWQATGGLSKKFSTQSVGTEGLASFGNFRPLQPKGNRTVIAVGLNSGACTPVSQPVFQC